MKMRTWMLGALAVAALAGSAQAQVFDNCVDATTPVGEGTYAFDLSTATNDAAGTCGATQTAQDLWINYRPTQSANCIVSTCGISFFDTVLAAYDACGGTPIVCVDDFCGLQTTIEFPVTAGTSYFIRIADFAGGTGAGEVNITLDTAPTNPSGVGAATPDRAPIGGTSLITVAVTPGLRPDSTGLQVTADLSQIDAGGTGDALFDDGTHGDAAAGDLTFSREVTVGANAGAGNQTIGFTVQDAQSRRFDGSIGFFVTPPPPANDNCDRATEVTASGNYDFDTLGATVDGTASCGAAAASPDVWYRVTATNTGDLIVATCGLTGMDTVLTAFDACNGNQLLCLDDFCGLQTQITVGVTANTPVWIRLAGFAGTTGTGQVSFELPGLAPPGRWTEDGDAGDLPDTAQVPTGSGDLTQIRGNLDAGDADMYRIRICNYASFDASMQGGANFDTQLFLFNTDGMGVTFNDDTFGLLSHLTAQFVTADGDYFLAFSGYDHDPDSANGPIWIDTPFNVERQPDGAGAADPIASWSGGGGGGPYTITLTGVCFPGAPRCVADVDDGTFTGHPDGGVTIDDLLYYLVIYSDGSIAADVDNGTFTGTQDGGVTIDDLLYFLFRYSEGC